MNAGTEAKYQSSIRTIKNQIAPGQEYLSWGRDNCRHSGGLRSGGAEGFELFLPQFSECVFEPSAAQPHGKQVRLWLLVNSSLAVKSSMHGSFFWPKREYE